MEFSAIGITTANQADMARAFLFLFFYVVTCMAGFGQDTSPVKEAELNYLSPVLRADSEYVAVLN